MNSDSQQLILVVDDEHTVADTLVSIMNLFGYRAVAAYSATEALGFLRNQRPAMMVSDVIMPDRNGVELAIEARRLWPEIPILLVSGNAATQGLMDTAHHEGYTFEILAKPVPPKQLLTRIYSILNTLPA
jgi:two-component system response regulator AtoC